MRNEKAAAERLRRQKLRSMFLRGGALLKVQNRCTEETLTKLLIENIIVMVAVEDAYKSQIEAWQNRRSSVAVVSFERTDSK